MAVVYTLFPFIEAINVLIGRVKSKLLIPQPSKVKITWVWSKYKRFDWGQMW